MHLVEEDLTGNDSGQNLAFEKDMPEFTRGLVNDLMKVIQLISVHATYSEDM